MWTTSIDATLVSLVLCLPSGVLLLYPAPNEDGGVVLGTVDYHCVKRVRIRSFSGSYFPALGLNTDQKNSEYG